MLKSQLEIFVVILTISLKRRKNGDITEDDLRSQTDDVQKATDNSIKEIDQLVADKEKILCQYRYFIIANTFILVYYLK